VEPQDHPGRIAEASALGVDGPADRAVRTVGVVDARQARPSELLDPARAVASPRLKATALALEDAAKLLSKSAGKPLTD